MAFEIFHRTCHPFAARVSSVNGVSFSEQYNSVFFSTVSGDIVNYDLDRSQAYSYFRAHKDTVLSLRAYQKGVASISSSRLALHTAGGLLEEQWSFDGIQCMSLSRALTSSVFVGTSSSVHYVSLRSRECLATIPVSSPCTAIAAADQIYAGLESGQVEVIDPRSSKVVSGVEAHPGGVTSMWTDGQLLVTAGLTYKQDMHVLDNALRLYDLRTMKMIMPWPIPLGSSAVKISSWPTRIVYALCPLSYQIASVHLDCEPLVRQIIPLPQNDDVLCFDVAPNNSMLAYGTVMGMVNLISCNETSNSALRKTSYDSVGLSYPEESYLVDPRSGPSRSSDWLGDDRYWGRTRPLTDARLLATAQVIDGIGYARNDRGILPNQVHIVNKPSIAVSNPQARIYGLTMLDSEVSNPHWNQIIRACRQSNFIYNRVIEHCNSGRCQAFVHCVLCELALVFRTPDITWIRDFLTASLQLESLNVPSSEAIHIQHFLRALLVDVEGEKLMNVMQSDLPTFRKLERAFRYLLSLLPPLHGLYCRSCEASLHWSPVILVTKMQGSLMKSLQNALETSFKCRSWCDKCQGYRDFAINKTELGNIAGVIFVLDPSLYRQFHILEELLPYHKDQSQLYLKSLLAETHSNTTDGSFDLRAAIKTKSGSWIRCQNETISLEALEASKIRYFVLIFDHEDYVAHKTLQLDPSLPLTSLKGHPLAIDAEYVFYDKALMEFHSDGSQSLVKPKKTRLARLSIVDGVEVTRIVIDEHVALEKDEVIVDYCSHISGITERDLLPSLSKHRLTSRKKLLLRLQGLIDAGCKFIGHGLANDFRVFNISIPGSQLLDTVRLFHLPGNRSLSLKFLAWHFLSESIQTDEHDSVIDARTTARLYHCYRELRSQGEDRLMEAIERVYSVGAEMEWQPPRK